MGFNGCEDCWDKEIPNTEKSEKCHYCNVDDDDYYGDIFKDEETGFWFLDYMTGELDERDGGFIHEKIYIKHCPWCGRKL